MKPKIAQPQSHQTRRF